MISVEKASHILKTNIFPIHKTETLSILKAVDHVLFEDIYAPINMPPFPQSAMDGYALCLHDSLEYDIKGEIKAGDNLKPELKTGDALRIFTGAPVPETGNAVVMQEKVTLHAQKITLNEPVTSGSNIRAIGEQIKKGDIALKKGTKLTPVSIGFLSSLGITEVSVYKHPSIAIIVTGNEIVEAGQPLAYGQIYDSNSVMLQITLNKLGYTNISMHKVDDKYTNTLNKLDDVINNNDLVLVSGGISVGDYDFVGKALQELHVKELFYKVNQKPGKPLFFGKKDDTVIFGLPGNPAASLSCFYIYVQTALQIMSGNMDFSLNRTNAISESKFIKHGDRAQFLKAIYKHGNVTILDGQSSSMLHTFALANALVYVPESRYTIEKNESVETILLPVN